MERSRPTKRSLSLTLAAAALFAGGTHAQSVEVLAYERLGQIETTPGGLATTELRTGTSTDTGASIGPITMSFDAFGRRFAFDLEPNARVNEIARKLPASDGATAYRGTLTGRPGSWARIVVAPAGPAGLVWDGATLYGIEPPTDSVLGADETTIFRLDDVYVPPGTLSCGMNAASMTGAQMIVALVDEAQIAAAQGATLNLDIGAVVDVEFSQSHADSTTAVLTRLNNVDGIFSEQVGVQITVQQVDVFTTETDPFTTSNASDLLEELAIYRGSTPAQDALGLTHLFTGRNLDGSTVGVAYLGALCARKSQGDPLGRSFGAGLSSSRNNVGPLGATLESLVAAHEIGHNFGAPHDGEAPCETTPTTFLMAPSLNGSDQFSACSIAQMQPEIASASCITDIEFVDVSLSGALPGAGPLAGAAFDYTMTATNAGAADAASVMVELSFDAALEVIALTPASGSCGAPASTVTCDLGALPGSTSRSIVARLRSTTSGGRAIAGTATASGDVAIANDSFSDTFNVAPAIDLAVSASALSIERDQASSLAVTLRNLAGDTAQSVELTASASAGVRIDSATIDGQACAMSGSVTTCSVASLTGLSSTVIAIALTGVTSGAATISLTATALEPDTNLADNALSASVTIVDPPAAQSSGGGGSTDGWLLLMLLCATAFRCRRERREARGTAPR